MATALGGLDTFTSITISLNSLAASTSGVGRASTAVDNGTNKYVDALVQLTIVGGTGTPSNGQGVDVYAYGSLDGTTYGEGVSGTDAGYTVDNPSSLPILGRIPILATGVTRTKIFDIAAAFSGYVPKKWGIVVVNNTGLTLASSGHAAGYSGGLPTVA